MDNEQLPKGMIPQIPEREIQLFISTKDYDYAGVLLRKLAEIREDFDFNLIALQINEGEDKPPTISLVLQVVKKEVKDAVSK